MNSLEIHNLQKYYGKKHILHNINLYLPKGSILGLIGPNGAGKSTIMKAILGLTHYSAGTIKISNEVITKNKRSPLSHVGSLIESPALYNNLTGYDHLKLYTNKIINKSNLIHIAKETNIISFMNKKVKDYSLGMKQALGIAITLLNKPKLLILDEPMNGLDTQSTYNFRQLFLRLSHNGISILISSHILDELSKLANYYAVINKGHILTEQNAVSFLSKNKYKYEMKTNNNMEAGLILKSANITYQTYNNEIIVSHNYLNTILKIFVNKGIQIRNITQLRPSLENKLLNVLKNGVND